MMTFELKPPDDFTRRQFHVVSYAPHPRRIRQNSPSVPFLQCCKCAILSKSIQHSAVPWNKHLWTFLSRKVPLPRDAEMFVNMLLLDALHRSCVAVHVLVSFFCISLALTSNHAGDPDTKFGATPLDLEQCVCWRPPIACKGTADLYCLPSWGAQAALLRGANTENRTGLLGAWWRRDAETLSCDSLLRLLHVALLFWQCFSCLLLNVT